MKNLPLYSCAFLLAATIASFAQGDLTPSGAPGPTMKALDQVEPRVPISSLPFVITNAGSYYLTGNLSTTNAGINIQASGVTLDLSGFELAGGTGAGIRVSAGMRTNIVIRNGTIRGWDNFGVDAGNGRNVQLEKLRVSHNASVGIYTGRNCTVSDCTVMVNGADGINVGDGTVVTRCTVQSSGGTGIIVQFDGTISDCVSRQNTGAGIFASFGSSLKNCTANSNGTKGLNTGSGCILQDCIAISNGLDGILTGEGCSMKNCVARSNGGDGISTDTGSTITGCTSSANTSNGIVVISSCFVTENTCQGNGATAAYGAGILTVSSRNRVDSNTVMGNDEGIKSNPATANFFVRNSARGNTNSLNYNIVPGNNSGAIVLNPGVGFSSSNAWANFEF